MVLSKRRSRRLMLRSLSDPGNVDQGLSRKNLRGSAFHIPMLLDLWEFRGPLAPCPVPEGGGGGGGCDNDDSGACVCSGDLTGVSMVGVPATAAVVSA
jgi:hypothetical protein